MITLPRSWIFLRGFCKTAYMYKVYEVESRSLDECRQPTCCLCGIVPWEINFYSLVILFYQINFHFFPSIISKKGTNLIVPQIVLLILHFTFSCTLQSNLVHDNSPSSSSTRFIVLLVSFPNSCSRFIKIDSKFFNLNTRADDNIYSYWI